jgi:hypothetical protein
MSEEIKTPGLDLAGKDTKESIAAATQPPTPNIIFVRKRTVTGKDGKPIKIPAEAPRFIRDGMTEVYELPDTETQQAGFYHEKAEAIRRLFPDAYKLPFVKGEK